MVVGSSVGFMTCRAQGVLGVFLYCGIRLRSNKEVVVCFHNIYVTTPLVSMSFLDGAYL